ncbi:MAG: copper chaperone PCu(A)C [Anaerolineales bacterium]|uniref:Copper chaperone PCu(A)C n=1 Tax=Candidatus Desulfolinea nitratireducens TaxID=2841698 RepID=A0A8J6NIT9_9CHLR|nr:copper chaperone PCu(A)C [Candidatus Desulfolinea nitratireducens]MBL6962033.1 copper chaperone PCu(A)C [Anaerolineales bacterium]
MMKSSLLFILTILVLILAACGASAGNDSLEISDVWARPGLADGNGAVYFLIDNSTGEEDTLISASSDIAQAVEIHISMMDGEVMQMKPQHEVSIPVGKTEFKPGGLHVMLIGLHDDLNTGDNFQITLKFQTAGEEILEVTVKKP